MRLFDTSRRAAYHLACMTNEASVSGPTRICPQCEAKLDDRYCNACRTSTVSLSVVNVEKKAEHAGRVLADQYKLIDELGKGGMGTVYRGVQLSVDRPVAVKLISAEIASDLGAIKRFQIEAKVTSRLSHPNIIRLYDFGVTDDGLLYLVMELLQGRELADEMAATGALGPQATLEIGLQVLYALREAHDLNIVHRDLKPANIFVTQGRDGPVIKVMDFGIAKLVAGNDLSKVTKTGMIVGTPAYMSPEQARGEGIDHRSDFYSLGIILYEMLTGKVPFEAATPVSVLLMHVGQTPRRLIESRPDLPALALVQPLMDKLLAKGSDERPADANSAINLVRELLKTLPEDAAVAAAGIEMQDTVAAMPTPIPRAAVAPSAEMAPTGAMISAPQPAVNPPTHPTPAVAPPSQPAMPAAAAAHPNTAHPNTAHVAKPGPATQPHSVDLIDVPKAPEHHPASKPNKTGIVIALIVGGFAMLVAAGLAATMMRGEDGAKKDDGAKKAGPVAVPAEKAPEKADKSGQKAEAPAENAEKPAADDEKAAKEADEKAAGGDKPAGPTKITIVSKPHRAEVFVDNKSLGKTPHAIMVSEPTDVVLKKRGYEDSDLTLNPGEDPVRIIEMKRARRGRRSTRAKAPAKPGADKRVAKPAPPPPPPPPPARKGPEGLVDKAAGAAKRGIDRARALRERVRDEPKKPSDISSGGIKLSRIKTGYRAKRMYREGKINRQEFNTVVRKLKLARNTKITRVKQLYRSEMIDEDEYRERIRKIKLDYWGPKE